MADDDTFDMADAYERCKEQGLLQTKAKATAHASKADKSVDGRSLQRTGRSAQIYLKVTPAFAEYLRHEAAKAGLGLSQYVEQRVMGPKP